MVKWCTMKGKKMPQDLKIFEYFNNNLIKKEREKGREAGRKANKQKKKKQTSNWYILLSTHSTFADLMYFGSNKCVCWNLWFFFLLNCHWISSLCIVFLSLFHVSLHNFLMEKGGVTTRGSSWSKGRWSWNPYAWANNRATFCFVNHFLWGQLLLLHPVE